MTPPVAPHGNRLTDDRAATPADCQTIASEFDACA